jgi:nicotinate-nucleotide pyrophosphorylase (carboxylating)
VEGLTALVRRALDEDIGPGDITTEATVEEDADARALITQKAPGAIYGLDAAATAFALLDPDVRTERLVQEGVWREQGGPVMSVEGRARALLSAERTALNFLAHLSGVATMAARAARAAEGTGAKVLDTRKTTPGLRALEKAAVAAGGARNHRAGLHDAILIKVEVRDAAEIEQALAAGVPRLLLDNMDDGQLRAAVAQVAGRAELEASGGVTLQTLRARAQTGVEWVSMGALTHSAPALDLSLILEVSP